MSLQLPPRDHPARAYLDVDALVRISSSATARARLRLPEDAASVAARLFAADPAITSLHTLVRDEHNALWLAEARRETAHAGECTLLWRLGSLDQFA